MKNRTLLQITDLRTFFYTNRGVVKAVNGLDIEIGRGETLGLVGESGCGKSVTALSVMRLIQSPPGKIAGGSIVFDDQDLIRLNEEKMRRIRGNRISMIFQEPMTSLNPAFRIGNQIAEVLQLHEKLPRRTSWDRSVDMLGKVGIPDPGQRVREYPYQMSGGMRQRVMIAMALACNPELVIADEPTTALDVTIQAQILDLMNDLKADFGASILLITHDLGVVAEMSQWIAVMYAGRIVEYADVYELFRHPEHPYTNGLMKSIPNIDAPVPEGRVLQTIPGVVPSLLDLPPGCAFEDRCDRAFETCLKQAPPLFKIGSGHQVRCWHHAR
ncbi:MAG: ABC transporter ATP-binding protein [Desulfobacteraceae bacterium]|nr:MAG: ABC transporter ATP-binding protein [Desulfobacteraceae bacterium]